MDVTNQCTQKLSRKGAETAKDKDRRVKKSFMIFLKPCGLKTLRTLRLCVT